MYSFVRIFYFQIWYEIKSYREEIRFVKYLIKRSYIYLFISTNDSYLINSIEKEKKNNNNSFEKKFIE